MVPEFEAAIDPNPEKGSLYRVLAAYACLDPHTGYVQGMNFIAALIVAPTVLAQQPQVSTAPTPASMPASADAGALNAVTTSTTTTTAAAPSSSSFQGCPLSIEDERAAFELFVRLMQASGVRRVFDARDDYLHCLLLRLEFHVKGFLPYLHEHLDQARTHLIDLFEGAEKKVHRQERIRMKACCVCVPLDSILLRLIVSLFFRKKYLTRFSLWNGSRRFSCTTSTLKHRARR